ncbi:gamma-glutamyltransferase, partial [Hydrogenophaga sp. 2FB]|uniref:gamma-glutamyltransferase family protein n=1 Tax=Hydrogenophaga sp. 2FB TaxID=2502187 RepID=UPI001484FCAB
MTRFACLIASLTLLSACGTPTAPSSVQQPEGASGLTVKPGWTFQRQAVAAANPLATEAGARILRAGGSAVDAAIAVQMVLTLVEPQSSGIGGGAFLLHYDGRKVQAYDGRETAPAAANERLFLDEQGKPLPFMTAAASGRSVGVPGAVAMLAQAHRQHGKLPWARLFDPAIQLAERGFAVSPRLHTLLLAETALKSDPVAAAYFYRPDGQPHPVGHMLRNPELAQVLRNIATQGPIALHEGPVARAIVDKVQQHPVRPGSLSLDDLKRYQPREREALCHDYTTAQRTLNVCGFPPPSSGAIAVGQILGLLARTPQAREPLVQGAMANPLPSAEWLHSYTEASRLAFADRAQYVADPDFVAAPGGRWSSLLDARYLDERARLITPAR